jgi:hypothetical protein
MPPLLTCFGIPSCSGIILVAPAGAASFISNYTAETRTLLFPCYATEVVAGTACVCLLAAFEVRLLGFFVTVYSPSKFLGLLLHDILGSMLPSYIDDT